MVNINSGIVSKIKCLLVQICQKRQQFPWDVLIFVSGTQKEEMESEKECGLMLQCFKKKKRKKKHHKGSL